jgi:hypothetical protein
MGFLLSKQKYSEMDNSVVAAGLLVRLSVCNFVSLEQRHLHFKVYQPKCGVTILFFKLQRSL